MLLYLNHASNFGIFTLMEMVNIWTTRLFIFISLMAFIRKCKKGSFIKLGLNMETILYEATLPVAYIFVIVFFFVFYMFLISFPKGIIKFSKRYNLKYNYTEKQTRKFVIVGLIELSIFFILFLYGAVAMYINVVSAYKNGEYVVTEGYVEDFIPIGTDGNNRESFSINGIEFEYSNNSVQAGYCKVAKKGGVIYENGQHLKIGYVQYGSVGNVIVYVEDLSGIDKE